MEILFLKTTKVPIAKNIDEISRSSPSELVILHWTVSVYVIRFIVGKIVSSKILSTKIIALAAATRDLDEVLGANAHPRDILAPARLDDVG